MNTQQKTAILKKFISQIETYQSSQKSIHQQIKPNDFESFHAPQIDLVEELIDYQKQINNTVDQTYESVKDVLQQLSQLQIRKQNINKLLDSMTAIKQVKRLTYGLGSNPHEIYRNLSVYYQTKDKLFYCEKQIQKVQQQIIKIRNQFQTQFEQQLRKSNSDNISQIAKTLNLIAQHSKQQNKTSATDNLTKFYVEMIRKQLKTYQDDLFKIPIVGTNTSNSYIFFDISKDIMKVIVSTISNYRGNILKIGGQQSLQKIVIEILKFTMNGIILQIFMREKKYFQIDGDKKKSKEPSPKFKDYLNQFCAIWNQVERLRGHLSSQIPSSSSLHKSFQNGLSNCTNTADLIKINSEVIEGIKNYTRFKFNKLLQASPFVNSIWQINDEFLKKISDTYVKQGKQLYECTEAQDFLFESFSIFATSLKKVLETLNMLIISPVITFTNNILVQQDSFHAFKQLFGRILQKLPSNQSKYYTALVTLANTVPLMPNALKHQLSSIVIPSQLESHKQRLQSQLKQLIEICEYKAKQVINGMVQAIVSCPWYSNELKQDYKKTIQKWQGLAHEINQIYLVKTSQVHSNIIINEEFTISSNPKANKKIVSQQNIISLQKQVRSVILYYEVKGCSALGNFRKVLEYIQILLAQTEDNASQLMKKFNIEDGQQTKKLTVLRAMKID